MKETLDSQLSAMFDNELPAAECELLARRLARDEVLQGRWRRYAVINAALHGEHGFALRVNLAPRIHSVIAAEPGLASMQIASAVGQSVGIRRLWQGAAAAAVAASVATLSVLWLRSHSQLDAQSLVAQAPAVATTASGDVRDTTEPDSYVVPPTLESHTVVPTMELANYVVAHSEYSGPLTRRNLLSSLMASEAGNTPNGGESEEALPPISTEAPHTDVQDVQ